jgi:threonine synthase
LFKGYRELKEAGITDRLPRMIVVQAEQNSPVVTAIREGKQQVVPFTDVHTIAEAITSGNPPGGDEIVRKAQWYGWPAEDVSEEQILESQRVLAESGFFVEPASAVSLWALRKLRKEGRIGEEATVIMMLTGAGLKDFDVFSHHRLNVTTTTLDDVAALLRRIM